MEIQEILLIPSFSRFREIILGRVLILPSWLTYNLFVSCVVLVLGLNDLAKSISLSSIAGLDDLGGFSSLGVPRIPSHWLWALISWFTKPGRLTLLL